MYSNQWVWCPMCDRDETRARVQRSKVTRPACNRDSHKTPLELEGPPPPTSHTHYTNDPVIYQSIFYFYEWNYEQTTKRCGWMKRKRGARLSPTYHQHKPATDSFSGNSKLDRKEIGESHDNISVRYSLSHNHTKCSSVDMRNYSMCASIVCNIYTDYFYTHKLTCYQKWQKMMF